MILAIFLIILRMSMNYGQIQPEYIINVNVLFINEPYNYLATKAIDTVNQYLIDKSYYRLKLHIDKIDVNGTLNAETFLDLICNKYNESVKNKQPPHIVIDTTRWGTTSETVKLFTRTMGLPTVSSSIGQDGDLKQWRGLNKDEEKYLLQVMPPNDMLPQLIRALVTDIIIKDAAILYDATFVMKHKYKSLLLQIQARHVILPLANGIQARIDQIQRIRSLNINNYFILATIETIEDVLALVKPEFFDDSFAWFAITLDNDFIFTKIDYAKFLLIQPKSYFYFDKRLYMLRRNYYLIDKPEVVTLFYFDLILRSILAIKEILQSGLWNPNMTYLYCDDYHYNTPERNINLAKYFTKVTEPISFGEFVLSYILGAPFNGYMQASFKTDANIIHIRNGSIYSKIPYGQLEANLYPRLTLKDDNGTSKSFQADTVYRILTVVQPPFIIKDETAPNGYKGYCIDLINEIAKIVDFSYTIQEVVNGTYGRMDEEGNWNGIVRKLIDKEADIGLGAMSIMTEREMVVDFTVPYYDLVGITIMMHKPGSSYLDMFKFFTVLEGNVWLCIVASYFFTSFLLWAFERWSPYSYQNNRVIYKNNEEQPREFTLKECLWFSITSLTSQGGGEVPKNISGCLVAAVWWSFGFLIIAAYTANLSAFLTVSSEDNSLESLDDLTNQYKILYAPLNDSMTLNYFERMANVEKRFYHIWKDMILSDSLTPLQRSKFAVWESPLSVKYTKILQAIQDAKLPTSLEEAVERVRSSNSASGFAFLGEATDIRYLVMTNCDLQMVGEEFSRKPYGIAVQHGSHLKDLFNNVILTLLNNRHLEKLKEKWWKYAESQVNCPKTYDQSDGISIEDMSGVFIVIFGGIAIACIILLFELWWFKCNNKFICC